MNVKTSPGLGYKNAPTNICRLLCRLFEICGCYPWLGFAIAWGWHSLRQLRRLAERFTFNKKRPVQRQTSGQEPPSETTELHTLKFGHCPERMEVKKMRLENVTMRKHNA
jgi:hypothetical protein